MSDDHPPAQTELGMLAETVAGWIAGGVPVSRRHGPRAGEPIELGDGDHPPATTPTTPTTPRPRKTRRAAGGEQLPLTAAQLVSAPLTAATGRAWSLALPWGSVPWSLNDFWNRFRVAEVKKSIRGTAMVLAQAQHIDPMERCRVGLHVLPAQDRVRDAENPMPTMKALCDGLVDAGVVADDDPWRMVKEMPVIYQRVRGQPARLWLVIEELQPCPAAPAPRARPTLRARPVVELPGGATAP